MEIGLKWLKHWCSKCVFCFLRTGYQGCDHHIMQQNIYRVKASISCYVGIRQAIGVPFWTLTNGWNMWIERNIYILRIVFDFDPPKHPPSLNNCAYTDIYIYIYIYMYIDLKPLAAACTCKINIYIYIYIYVYMFMYYIILYIYGHPQPGPTLSFLFVVFAAEKTFILLTSFCVFYTATQVRYSLTRVFLQCSSSIATWLLHILRLRGWIRVMLLKKCFTSFNAMFTSTISLRCQSFAIFYLQKKQT